MIPQMSSKIAIRRGTRIMITKVVVGKPNMADNSFFEIIKAALPYNFLSLFEKKNMGLSPGNFTMFFFRATSVCPSIFHLLFHSC